AGSPKPLGSAVPAERSHGRGATSAGRGVTLAEPPAGAVRDRLAPLEVAIVLFTPPFLPASLQALRVFRLLRLARLFRLAPLARRLFSLEGLRYIALLAVLTVLGGARPFPPSRSTARRGTESGGRL